MYKLLNWLLLKTQKGNKMNSKFIVEFQKVYIIDEVSLVRNKFLLYLNYHIVLGNKKIYFLTELACVIAIIFYSPNKYRPLLNWHTNTILFSYYLQFIVGGEYFMANYKTASSKLRPLFICPIDDVKVFEKLMYKKRWYLYNLETLCTVKHFSISNWWKKNG